MPFPIAVLLTTLLIIMAIDQDDAYAGSQMYEGNTVKLMRHYEPDETVCINGYQAYIVQKGHSMLWVPDPKTSRAKRCDRNTLYR